MVSFLVNHFSCSPSVSCSEVNVCLRTQSRELIFLMFCFRILESRKMKRFTNKMPSSRKKDFLLLWFYTDRSSSKQDFYNMENINEFA